MKITAEQLKRIAKGKPDASNVKSMVVALNDYGADVGLDLPHRLAQFIPQSAHESGGYRFDREIWGPTPAQKRYDTRTDLGNTQAKDGDGKKNAGRGPFQLTGGDNIRRFEAWCVKKFGRASVPRFSENPDLINTDPWEGLSAIWYWDQGNPTRKSLNRYADENNIEMITKRINGGLNGYTDRLDYYDRTALVLLGYPLTGIKAFQRDAKKRKLYDGEIDGQSGPRTRAAFHRALLELTKGKDMPEHVAAGPVVETVEKEVEVEVEKPVEVPVPQPVPDPTLDKPFYKDPALQERVVGVVTTGGFGGWVAGLDWKLIASLVALILVVTVVGYFGIRFFKQKKRDVAVKAIRADADQIRGETGLG